MALTFLTGSKLILEDADNNGYEFLISSISIDQTFEETSRDVRTLHSKNLFKDTFIKAQSTASFSFTINLGQNDEVLFRWLGCSNVGGELRLPVYKESLLAGNDLMTLYLDSGTSIFKVTKCVIESLSIGMSKGKTLTLDITGSGEERTQIASLPSFSSYVLQGTFQNGPITAEINNNPVNNLAGFTFDVTRSISWLNQRTVSTGISTQIYKKTTPVLLDVGIGGQITANKNNVIIRTLPNSPLLVQYNNFTISLDACNFTDRWGVEAIFKKVTDYKLLSYASTPFIKF